MSEMQVEMDPEDTVMRLWEACDRWRSHAERFEQLAEVGFPEGSRGRADTAAAAVVEPPPVVSRYLQERAWNTVRMLRALHRWVFETEPGRLHLDPTVMYPLMRAALEDTATIVWLQSPEDSEARLSRALQALHQDQVYFAKNHLLLASTAAGLGGTASEMSEQLAAHIEEEKRAAGEYFAQLAERLGLDPRAVTGTLTTSAPITTEYGAASVERVTWGMMSDLSHFSFMMLRHLAESPIPGSTVPLLHATMLQFGQTLNRVCDHAIAALERSAAVSQ
ncbi:hypothetical protein PX701_18200 [Agromyces sp. H3Y2-19a]|uniref:hypothetical protein n=1 Tax=Agromyces chromiiresistens TaxID=3030835 RepID=UPI0023B99461|nr:hypothetical protein [Agromyces chromiiresistens]MDF0515563.1 hypothetical protein [Agromyces chromiiresistens]